MSEICPTTQKPCRLLGVIDKIKVEFPVSRRSRLTQESAQVLAQHGVDILLADGQRVCTEEGVCGVELLGAALAIRMAAVRTVQGLS